MSRAHQLRYERMRRIELRSHGICVDCKEDALPGILRCRRCNDRAIGNQARRVSRMRAAGICFDCKGESIPGRIRCRACADIFNARARARYLQRQRVLRSARDVPVRRYDLEEIARELLISRERVRQLLASALKKLRRECRRMGITEEDALSALGASRSMFARLEDHGW